MSDAVPPDPASDTTRRDLVGLSREALAAEMAALGEKPFRARQLWHWIYHRGVADFAAMTDLGKTLRAKLAERYVVGRPAVHADRVASDDTRKWLLGLADGNEVEAVHIPEEDRGALCLSSQVGCTLTCRFCQTGTQLLVRNLTAGEMVGQVLTARDAFGEWPTPHDGERRVSNLVVMGMGEPLFNTDNVITALNIAADPEGLALSRRRITLSTCGVVPEMRRVGEETGVNLAVSLHAVSDDVRDRIMPINRKYPLAELMDACRNYPGLSNARRITFEYLLLKDVNDSPADARELARLLDGIPCKINLLPFNGWADAPFEPSPQARMEAFSRILNDKGYTAPLRQPRGRDIEAACGQLRSASRRPPKSRHRARVAAGIEDPDEHLTA